MLWYNVYIVKKGDKIMKELTMFLNNLKVRGKEQKTVDQYKSHIMEFFSILEISTIEDLKKIVVQDFDTYLLDLQDRGNGDSTRNAKLSAVKSMYKYLCNNDLLDKNIAERIEHSKTAKKISVQPTREEAKIILDSVKHKPKLFTLYTLLMNSGLRIEEALTLKVQNFRENCIFVIDGKGGKDRIIPLNSTACATLENYITNHRKVWTKEMLVERHKGDSKLVEKALKDTDLVFLGKNGQRMFNSNINICLHNTAEVCGIDVAKVHPHAFRHYFANEFVGQNGKVNELQTLLGHESLTTTQIYFKNDVNKLKKTMETMSF